MIVTTISISVTRESELSTEDKRHRQLRLTIVDVTPRTQTIRCLPGCGMPFRSSLKLGDILHWEELIIHSYARFLYSASIR